MRPYNEQRVVVEYARILRIFETTDELFQPEPFADDLLARMESGVDRPALWWGHEWFLGNVEPERTADGALVGISARFGWSEDVTSPDVPPDYDRSKHEWSDEFGQIRHGAVALFTIDTDEQAAAVTSLAGDVSMRGFCHALTNLLNREELQVQSQVGARAAREWIVTPIDERGSFDNWVSTVEKVTSVQATFHLPNPRTRDDLQPAVDFLNREGARSGSLRAENRDGLAQPTGDPLVNAAVAMQENDYGTVKAKGERADRKTSSTPKTTRSKIG